MKTGIYINKGARFDNLHGYDSYGDDEIRAAYTHAGFVSLGLVVLKGDAYKVTGRAVNQAVATKVAGRAVSYWISKGYLVKGLSGVTMTRDGAALLTSRFNAGSLSYRTTRDAVRIVCHIMRTGDPAAAAKIGYIPVMI